MPREQPKQERLKKIDDYWECVCGCPEFFACMAEAGIGNRTSDFTLKYDDDIDHGESLLVCQNHQCRRVFEERSGLIGRMGRMNHDPDLYAEEEDDLDDMDPEIR
jgi:hypothetical protein